MSGKILTITLALVIGSTSFALARTHVKHGTWSHAASVNRGPSGYGSASRSQGRGYGISSAPLWESVTDDGGGRVRPCYGGG
jgi:hypothetical protein